MPAMRHLLTLSIVLSSVVVLVGLGLQDSPSPNPSPRLVNGDTTRAMQDLPPAVREYYRDYNFVAAFSTPVERMNVLSAAETGTLPELSERLRDVHRRMQTLRRHEMTASPKTMQPERILPSVMPQLLQVERVFRGDDVTEVASAPAEADDRLTVQVLAFPFGDPVNAKLVAAYDSGDTPSFSGAGSWKPTRRTVHRWYLVDGQWLRNPTSFQRLDPPTR